MCAFDVYWDKYYERNNAEIIFIMKQKNDLLFFKMSQLLLFTVEYNPVTLFSCLFYFSCPVFLDISGPLTPCCKKEQENHKIGTFMFRILGTRKVKGIDF